jgi:hypothetical protein
MIEKIHRIGTQRTSSIIVGIRDGRGDAHFSRDNIPHHFSQKKKKEIKEKKKNNTRKTQKKKFYIKPPTSCP